MKTNTEYATYLRSIAEEITNLTARPEGLQAILLQGSVAKGIADAYSDIELKFLWAAQTTTENRAAIFENVPKEPLFAEEQEDGEWVSAFLYKSVKIDISHLEMSTLQSIVQAVMESRNTSIASQALLASIQDSTALYGQEILDEINSQTANYPKELSTKCIKVNASFGEWSMRNALIERKDMIALHHLIDLTLLQMLRLLYALNQTWLRSYNFKWLRYHFAQLTIKPADLEGRVEYLLASSAEQAVVELDKLLHEVFELVQKQRTDIDIFQEKEKLNYVRQQLQIKE